MQCPSINDLPLPPSGKSGWPWTEESMFLPEYADRAAKWPRLTIVTPSFNQGAYIEQTIRSVLLQGYPDLEYIVMDGGSKDETAEIIRRYSPWMHFWISEADAGQSAAINRGLRIGTGKYAAWINSDDMLCRNACIGHFAFWLEKSDAVYVGKCINIDESGKLLFSHQGRIQSIEELLRVGSFWRKGLSIDQPAALFPRELALGAGGLNEDNHYTMDYELWGRLLLAGAKFCYTDVDFGIFRLHPGQKTGEGVKQTESMICAARNLLRASDHLSQSARQAISDELDRYHSSYLARRWTESGRLAQIGLPRAVVEPIRSLKNALEQTLSGWNRG